MTLFSSGEGVLRELEFVQICVKEKLKTINTYIEALCIPFTCSPIPNQNIDFSENSTKHLFRLQLADMYSNNNKPADILVGLDYFYDIITGKTIKGAPNTLVALESNLEFLYFTDGVKLIQRSKVPLICKFGYVTQP